MILKTPPLGWNSWNTFASQINDELIRESARAMVETGLKDAGYEYVVIDDCWAEKERGADGRLRHDREKFPRGIRDLADYVHSLGLKLGIYSCAGERTCAGYPGSYDHEFIDAATFAEWEVDFLKYDYCFRPRETPAPAVQADGGGAGELRAGYPFQRLQLGGGQYPGMDQIHRRSHLALHRGYFRFLGIGEKAGDAADGYPGHQRAGLLQRYGYAGGGHGRQRPRGSHRLHRRGIPAPFLPVGLAGIPPIHRLRHPRYERRHQGDPHQPPGHRRQSGPGGAAALYDQQPRRPAGLGTDAGGRRLRHRTVQPAGQSQPVPLQHRGFRPEPGVRQTVGAAGSVERRNPDAPGLLLRDAAGPRASGSSGP